MQPLDQGIIYYLKHDYQKCLVHFLLQKQRNIPTVGIRKWNVTDVMQGIVAWESNTSTATHKCFSKCSFGIEDAVVTEDDQDNSNWVEMQGHVQCPSNFHEFLNADQLMLTTKEHSATSQDVPDSKRVVHEQEEEVKGEEMQPLPVRPRR